MPLEIEPGKILLNSQTNQRDTGIRIPFGPSYGDHSISIQDH